MTRVIKSISFICCLFLTLTLTGQTITVQNLDDSGIGSLRNAISNANSGDTIRFNPMLIAQGSDTLVLDTVINIDKDLVIKGIYDNQDTLFMSIKNDKLLFAVDSVNEIVFDSLVLISDSNSVIYPWGTSAIALSYVNCQINNSLFLEFTNNHIYSWESNLKVNNCNFSHYHPYSSLIFFDTSGDSIQNLELSNVNVKSYTNLSFGFAMRTETSTQLEKINIFFKNSYLKNTKSYFNGNINIDILNSTFENSIMELGAEYTSSEATDSKIIAEIQQSTFTGDVNGNTILCLEPQTTTPLLIDFKLRLNNCTFNGGSYDTESSIDYFGESIDSLSITSCIFNDINGFNELPIDSSGGYNLFSFPQSIGLDSTDQTNVLVSDINLEPLQNNGGFTPTHVPSYQSLAFNSGNPNDTSFAQNGAIIQRRDIGAAEIQATLTIDTVEYCGEDYDWRNETLTESNIHFDVQESTTGGYDSVFALDLTLDYMDALAISDGGALQANISDATYQWMDCLTHLPLFGETNQTLTPSIAGTYAVVVSNGICTDTSACVFIDNLSVEEQVQSFVFVKNNVLYFNGLENAEFNIYNSLGQNVLSGNVKFGEINLSNFPNGLYSIQFKNATMVRSIKFVLN